MVDDSPGEAGVQEKKRQLRTETCLGNAHTGWAGGEDGSAQSQWSKFTAIFSKEHRTSSK